MSENIDRYTKADRNLNEREVIKKSDINLVNSINSFIKKIANNYIKIDKDYSSSLFLIISGGEIKERQYFSCLLSKPQKFPRIQIHFLSKNGEGFRTVELLETANNLRDKLKDSEIDSSDSIFLLSDRDHFYPEIIKIIPECIENGYNLIVSNPCFEIWLYYSYFNLSPIENGFQIPDVKKISSDFKTYLGQISKEFGGVDPRKAIFTIKEATKNSRENYIEDENFIPNIFSTNMFELAEELLPLIETELNNLIEENKLKELKFRKKR